MKLKDKFKRAFISPLIIGIVLSIIITVIILIGYAKNFADPVLVQRLNEAEAGKTNPIIYSVNNLLFKKFQKNFYALLDFKNNYLQMAEYIDLNYINVNTNLINKYCVPAVNLSDQEMYNTIIKGFETQNSASNISDNSTFLDHSFWFFNSTVNSVFKADSATNSQSLLQKQLMALINLTPNIRSYYTSSMNSNSSKIDLIYFANSETNLLFGYPVNKDRYQFYNQTFGKTFENKNSCKDQKGNKPNYYYFQCRDWWVELLTVDIDGYTQGILVANPYQQTSGSEEYAISVCIKFLDPSTSNKYSYQFSSICIDVDISELIRSFNYFNHQLTGYFYVVKVGSTVPVYYPFGNRSNYFETLDQYEFGINIQYFVEELYDFKSDLMSSFLQLYQDYDWSIAFSTQFSVYEPYQGTYFKGGELYNYTIYPNKYYIDLLNSTQDFHLLTIVYIMQPNSVMSNLQQFQRTLYPRLIIQIFLFGIMGANLVLIAWYLIISIAMNIVKPIKNLYKLIQGLEFKKAENSAKQKTNVNSRTVQQNMLLLQHKQSSKSDDEYDDDEDNNQIRSAEMDNLFNVLLQLKNVLGFTKSAKISYNKASLIKYVGAKYTFVGVNNIKGMNVCDSNIGNLSLKCRKYDKAIFHLTESMRSNDPQKGRQSTSLTLPGMVKFFGGKNKFMDVLNNWREDVLHFVRKKTKINAKLRKLQNLPKKNHIDRIGFNPQSNKDDQEEETRNAENHSFNLQKENESNREFVRNLQKIREELGSKHSKNSKNSHNSNNQNLINASNQMLVHSRYPKLIYSYKCFFKYLTKLTNQLDKEQNKHDKNNEFSEKFLEYDMFVVKDRHNLEYYENCIRSFIGESVKSEDISKIAEAFLEYIDFLINYKLKMTNAILLDNKSKHGSTLNKGHNSANLLKSKTIIIEEIMLYFKEFDIIYESLKEKSTPEYYKNFLEKMRNLRAKEINIGKIEKLETPYLVLYQRSCYLKGSLAFICGHYDRALSYFNRSKESLLICDAKIIRKSIKKIKIIMHFLKQNIEKEIEEIPYQDYQTLIKNNSDNELSELTHQMSNPEKHEHSKEKDFRDKYKPPTQNEIVKLIHHNIHKQKEKITYIDKYCENLTENLNSFYNIRKDMIILIDTSDRMKMDWKKIERSIKAANSFFEMYLSTEDRFGLFLYNNTFNPVVGLTEKNSNTYSYIKNILEDLLIQQSQEKAAFWGNFACEINNEQTPLNSIQSKFKMSVKDNITCRNQSNTCKAISLTYQYLRKKTNISDMNEREKWIIVFTDSFRKEENTEKDKEIFHNLKKIKQTGVKINIIVIGVNMDKDSSAVLIELLSSLSNHSTYIDFDNIGTFKNIIKIRGDIQKKKHFSNERYDSEKGKGH